MKKRAVFILVAALGMSLMLGGCGTPLYEMTDSERAVVTQYAAYVVAKHNAYQKDGMVYVNSYQLQKRLQQELEGPEEETEAAAEPETETQEIESSGEIVTDTADQPQEEVAVGRTISCEEAFKLPEGISLVYKDFFISDYYLESGFGDPGVKKGNKRIVVEFTMKNTSDQAIAINNMGAGLGEFKGCFNGSDWIDCDSTIAASDLTTYLGSMEPGEEAVGVLLFQVPEGEADTISNVEIQVLQDNEKDSVKL